MITFQSVVDFTVSTPAIVAELYARLPANGSELVLFDINRNANFGPLLRPSADALLGRLERMMPPPPRAWRSTIIANIGTDSSAVQERSVAAGAGTAQTRALGLSVPSDVYRCRTWRCRSRSTTACRGSRLTRPTTSACSSVRWSRTASAACW